MNFFVSVIREDGTPGPLYGPYDYEKSEEVLIAVLKSNNTQNGPVEITEEVKEAIQMDGSYSFESGIGAGGVYIVQSEEFDLDETDEVEQQRRDEKNGLYGGVEDSAN